MVAYHGVSHLHFRTPIKSVPTASQQLVETLSNAGEQSIAFAAMNAKIRRRKGACTECRQRKIRCDGGIACSHCKKTNLTCFYKSDLSYSEPRLQQRKFLSRSRNRPKQTTKDARSDHESGDQNSDMEFSSDDDDEDEDEYDSTRSQFQQHRLTTRLKDPDLLPDSTLYQLEDVGPGATHVRRQTSASKLNAVWSRMWANDMCDFRTLMPLSFLDRYTTSPSVKSRVSTISDRLLAHTQSPVEDMVPHNVVVPLDGMLSDINFCMEHSYQESIDAFFDESYWYSPYIIQTNFQTQFSYFLMSPSLVEPAFLGLAKAVLAVGFNYIHRRNRVADSRPEEALKYFQAALVHRPYLQGGAPDLIKIQTLVTLSLGCSWPNVVMTNQTELKESCVKTMYWYIYSIEKPLTMRFGHFSILDDNFINHQQEGTGRSESSSPTGLGGWELVRYEYARLCSLIVKSLYSQNALLKSRSQMEKTFQKLHQKAMAWELSIPSEYRPGNGDNLSSSLGHGCHDRIRVDLTFKYCEAMFAIHRWSVIHMAPDKTYLNGTDGATSSKICLQSARSVLSVVQVAGIDDTNWPFIYMPLVAGCIIFLASTKSKITNRDLGFMSVACDFYRRLALAGDGDMNLFADISQLSSITHFMNSEEAQV